MRRDWEGGRLRDEGEKRKANRPLVTFLSDMSAIFAEHGFTLVNTPTHKILLTPTLPLLAFGWMPGHVPALVRQVPPQVNSVNSSHFQ